ncbi:MAG: hypothetical protein AXW16_02195 [Cycloclasticus sp. Phe_18]|nr:MAG: hypothetical protein AXW16_02195 [Cycloclasticus sp. Phe_18]
MLSSFPDSFNKYIKPFAITHWDAQKDARHLFQTLGRTKGVKNVVKIFLTLLIILISACYILYGSAVLVSKDASLVDIMFGLISVCYGALALMSIIIILVSNKPLKNIFVSILGAVFLVLFMVDVLDADIISGHEIWGFAKAASPIIINWFALNKLVGLTYSPNKHVKADVQKDARPLN